MPELPSGTVTFLFTDIERSTTRWERHPQAMRQVLARHDALLHEGISAHGGVVLTERGEGDSFFALFARPSDALAAACALQRALAAEPWPQEVAPIRVRMAVHSGEAGMREGRDYRGAAVNRCARLRAVAHGGQVLLSGATYELVRDLLPPDITLRDLGAHRLKDLTRPEHIFQVLHPDLPGEFPPLKTLDRQRHNLPVQPTALIGREREVVAVRERLLEPATRLLTLTGPGGTGKTRLALQVAAESLEAFPDGVFFVNLAPVGDPDLVLPTIAQTLEVREAGDQPLHETLHAFLQDKRLLLVLDNFEQVLDAAPVVSDLLAACPALRVLVTSRTVLHLRGEHLYAVPPLTLPELRPLPPLERLTQYEAVRLFIARAQQVKPDFAVTNETAPAIAEICVRLDGLPLAIELAAAHIRLLPPPALLTRLSSRLKLLTGGARDLPARQQTLRATINWSYSLLTEEEQTLFAQLGVFVGGCILEAVEVVCTPEGDVDVLARLESLIEKSLLRQEEGVGGEPRVGMLETIHEYAWERLAASGGTAELRRRHAAYFLALAEEAEPLLQGPEQGRWLSRLEAEHGNLRAALTWSIQTGAVETGLRLAGALWWFWQVRGNYSEGRSWLEAVLARSGEGAAPVRAKVLRGAGVLAWAQGDYGRAKALTEAALALHGDIGDRRGVARALNNLGLVAQKRGDYGQARVLYEEALTLHRELGDRHGIAIALNNLGSMIGWQGDYGRALALQEEALVLFREVGDRDGVAQALYDLGLVACWQGDHERAKTLLEEALALFRDLEDRPGIGGVLNELGYVASAQGDDERARVLLTEALALHRELGDRLGIAIGLNHLGPVAVAQGDYGQAKALQQEALVLFEQGGDKPNIAECLENLAKVACAQGQPERATRLCAAGAALRSTIGTPLPPSARATYDRAVAAAREALGADAFAAAWAAGQALPLEQAIAEALTEAGVQPWSSV